MKNEVAYVLVTLYNATEMSATNIAVLPIGIKGKINKFICVVPEVKNEKRGRDKGKEIGKETFQRA